MSKKKKSRTLELTQKKLNGRSFNCHMDELETRIYIKFIFVLKLFFHLISLLVIRSYVCVFFIHFV